MNRGVDGDDRTDSVAERVDHMTLLDLLGGGGVNEKVMRDTA